MKCFTASSVQFCSFRIRFNRLIILFLAVCIFAAAPVFADTQQLDLTPEEKAYLSEHPSLKLGVGVAFPPIQYVEEKLGRKVFKGLVADYLEVLEQRLGVRLEPVMGITFKEALEMGRAGTIDLFPCVAETPERRTFLAYTKPYLTFPLVVIGSIDGKPISSVEGLSGMTLAVVKTLAMFSKYERELAHLNLKYHFVPDLKSELEAVSQGKADACIANLAVASYLIGEYGIDNLMVVATTPWKANELAMAVPNDRAILASIMQKALDSISQEERDAIWQQWVSITNKPKSMFSGVTGVAFLGGAVAVLLAAVLYWRRRAPGSRGGSA